MKIGHPADLPATAPAAHGVPNNHASANGVAHARGTRAADTPAAATPPTAPAAEPSATLQLSKAASSLLSGGAPTEFDAEKVARISKAIEDGTFRVNPGAIADKLIANAQELLTKVQS